MTTAKYGSFARKYALTGLLCVAAALHGIFMWGQRDRRLELTVIDPPPRARAMDALSFGDRQFLYRYWALDLQNDGDTGGRATPMRDYNYDYVLGWLTALQALDDHAQHHVFLAARYFSQVPNLGVIRRLVDFIVADVDRAPAEKWYWLTQAVEMAEHKLNDKAYALAIARHLAAYDFPNIATWVWLFPAVLLEKDRRYAEARQIIDQVRRDKHNRLEPETLNWMNDFLRRLPSG